MDDEIRTAFQALADRAVHPARVQQVLNRTARDRGTRRALLVAGGVAAGTAAVGGGAAAWRALTAPAPPVTPATTTPTPAPTTAGNRRITMLYRPGYLPDGLREVHRWSYLPDAVGQGQNFSSRPIGDHRSTGHRGVELRLTRSEPWQAVGNTEIVDVGGAEGRLWEGSVGWRLASGRYLCVSAWRFDSDTETALQVARAVVPDGVSTLEVPVQARWFPDGEPVEQLYRCAPEMSPSSLTSVFNRERSFGASFGLVTYWPEPPSGEPTTVRGQASFRTGKKFIVPLPDGRSLHAEFDDSTGSAGRVWSDEDMLRVIEELHIGPAPANEWYVTA